MSLTDPVTATLLHLTSLWRNVLRTPRVGHDGDDVLAGLVEADPVVPAPHTVLDDAHVENARAVVQPAGHYLALHVFVLVVSLTPETSQSSNIALTSPLPSLSLHQH